MVNRADADRPGDAGQRMRGAVHLVRCRCRQIGREPRGLALQGGQMTFRFIPEDAGQGGCDRQPSASHRFRRPGDRGSRRRGLRGGWCGCRGGRAGWFAGETGRWSLACGFAFPQERRQGDQASHVGELADTFVLSCWTQAKKRRVGLIRV